MSYGEIVEYFEKLTQQDSPFAVYPILHVKPQR
jgi:hypothetical protein